MNPRDRSARARELLVGDVVPELDFMDTLGVPLSLGSVRGRPFVIAFAPTWAPGALGTVREADLRAELRGLGVALLVVAADAAWFLEADDARRDLCSPRAAVTDAASELRSSLGLQPGADPLGLALFVVDAKGFIRRIHREMIRPRASFAVLQALRVATEALRARDPQAIVLNRRELVVATLTAAFALLLPEACTSPAPAAGSSNAPPAPPSEGGPIDLKLRVNGTEHSLSLEPRVTLLDALRESLGLTGTKKGCDHGQCGACTVLVGGRRINSCLTFAVMHQDTDVITIEGLANGDELHPLQAAFIEHDAFQCGYCTPGQIMSAVALLAEGRARGPTEIRELMSGNICRCGAYPNIVAAIRDVQGGS